MTSTKINRTCTKGSHKHWVFGKKWQQNTCHPLATRHTNIESRIRHDLATGKLTKWAKKNNLNLTDATYQKYAEMIRK